VRLGIERAGGCGGTQGRDGVAVASLPRERETEVEQRVGIVGSLLEDAAERALRVDECLTSQMLPSVGEGSVGIGRFMRAIHRAAPRSNGIANR
jgi:hypothetical protein